MNARERLLRSLVRDVPDFPKPGIVFKDITPVIGSAAGLRAAVAELAARYRGRKPTKVVGIESRGFIFGAPLADRLGVGFVPVRKPGKLPYRTRRERYALEYGTDAVEIHVDAVGPGDRVVVVDDLLATGGTAAATVRLVRRSGARVLEAAFVIELGFLRGRRKLRGVAVHSLVRYD
ncbi:MAG: adenine phosphoribosyltransferase [Deltaproteobacteria bacterium]|nr:adenine phosphoribosyltransferase [Deltaproteobacteria bacterium]